VRRARERDSVAHNIRTTCLNWPNMRSGNFRSTAAIDKFQPSNCAALIMRTQDSSSENAVSHDPRDGKVLTFELLIELE